MRVSPRLFASVARTSQYLIPGSRTGLTGIITHKTPRPHLIYLYNTTLEKLSTLPSHSAYRQSVEALTRHRLRAVESVVPEGHREWLDRIGQKAKDTTGPAQSLMQTILKGKGYAPQPEPDTPKDPRYMEWDNEWGEARAEGPAVENDRTNQAKEFGGDMTHDDLVQYKEEVEDEPPLTRDQVSQIEHKLGSGLIEEVIKVAQGELELIDTMKEYDVWRELDEKPAEGQWQYFERATHTGQTQIP